MKYWPLPRSCSKIIPINDSPGSFWEDRNDRHHCGVDIYAPEGSDVLSVEDGEVIDVGIFTSSAKIPYWNTTYYILIKNKTGFICKYAELGDTTVGINGSVKAGQLIGNVGLVLNSDRITEKSPSYIKEIDKNKNHSMLHFELYRSIPAETKDYSGGNWFGYTKPKILFLR